MRLPKGGETEESVCRALPVQTSSIQIVLSSEPMKNAREHTAGMNLLHRLAISLGIDTPCHCIPRFVAEQADRKLVGALAGNDGGALDPFNDEGGRRTNRIWYFACQ